MKTLVLRRFQNSLGNADPSDIIIRLSPKSLNQNQRPIDHEVYRVSGNQLSPDQCVFDILDKWFNFGTMPASHSFILDRLTSSDEASSGSALTIVPYFQDIPSQMRGLSESDDNAIGDRRLEKIFGNLSNEAITHLLNYYSRTGITATEAESHSQSADPCPPLAPIAPAQTRHTPPRIAHKKSRASKVAHRTSDYTNVKEQLPNNPTESISRELIMVPSEPEHHRVPSSETHLPVVDTHPNSTLVYQTAADENSNDDTGVATKANLTSPTPRSEPQAETEPEPEPEPSAERPSTPDMSVVERTRATARERGRYIKAGSSRSPERFFPGEHNLVKLQVTSNARPLCRECQHKVPKKKHKTNFECDTCRVPLHPLCTNDYHSSNSY